MILLLGGTSDTAPVAEAVAAAGYQVLVSTVTDIPLHVGTHPRITHRRGRLNRTGMMALVRKHLVRAIVDVTHPYASEAHSTSSSVAEQARIPYLRYLRPGVVSGDDHAQIASSHAEAARMACDDGGPVLVTVGSKNLRAYADVARRAGVRLTARILDHADSVRAAHEAGMSDIDLVTGRGPFGVEQNRELIHRSGAKILVTKDSGRAGGVREKLEAARLEGCRVIVVAMPDAQTGGGFQSVSDLIRELEIRVPATNRCVIALDLESVLIPEIWETIARVASVPELAVTTRDLPDYGLLMQRRMQLCEQHGLTLARLRQIVATMEPLPGALKFLGWAQAYAMVAIVSDSFYELAGPIVAKLGCRLITCNWLIENDGGYISGFHYCNPLRKVDSVLQFQRHGFRVLAVGDSYNDLEMLDTADAGFLFRPTEQLETKHSDLKTVRTYADLEMELRKASLRDL